MDNERFIVATDQGIFYKLQQAVPGQGVHHRAHGGGGRHLSQLRQLPVDGDERAGNPGRTCFDRDDNEIFVDPALGERAMVPLRRMLDFAAELQADG